jgi:hypothetical protein
MTSLLPAHSLAANRTFQNQKSGCSTTNGKICTMLVCKNTCKLLLILSVTFIWSHPSVGLNGLWFMIAFIFPSLNPPPPPPPPTVANISGKNFLGALFIPKVPLETDAPQLFDASYAPAYYLILFRYLLV